MPPAKQHTLYQRVVNKWTDKDQPYDRLESARADICEFFRPDLGVDYDESADMIQLGGSIYEGSGPWVARTASTMFQGNTVSKKLDWFRYKFSDLRLSGIDELDTFTQNMKEHMASVYQEGNFYDIQPQFTLDGWTTGSPLYFLEEDIPNARTMAIVQHYKTYRIYYDRFNRSEGVILKDEQWTAKRCFDKFVPPGPSMETRLAKAKEIFSIALYTALSQGRTNDRFTIWRAVFKATDLIWNGGDFKPPAGDREWYDVYFEDVQPQQMTTEPLLTAGYASKPYVHWDFNKKPWESASRTPAFEGIFDNLSNNQIFKSYLDGLQEKVRPSLAALEAMRGRLDLSPEGVTYLNPTEWNNLPTPIRTIGDIKLLPETVKIFRENLGRWFHLETFRMFSNMAENTNQDFRVLQLMEIQGERITALLPTIESHEHYLADADQRARDIEVAAGNGPFNRLNMENIFDILVSQLGDEAFDVEVAPEFIGTLRQTQQMQQKLKPLQFGVAALSEIAAAMGDENLVRFMIKGFETGDEALRAVNFPQKLIAQQEDYQALQEQFLQSQANNEQFAKVIEMMKASGQLPEQAVEQMAGT